jgi:undecaprenyl-diphosphatase
MSQMRIHRPVAVFAISALLFGVFGSLAFTQDDPNRGFFYKLDQRIALRLYFHQLRHPYLAASLRTYGDVAGTWSVLGIAVLGGGMLLVRGERRLAITWWVALLGIWGLNELLKLAFQSPRPEFAIERSYGYPSGMAVRSLFGYGFLAYVLLLRQSRGWERAVSVILLSLVVLGVGFSRIYLASHWLTDVLGGYALSGCVLVLIIANLEGRRNRLRLATKQSEAVTFAPITVPP